MRASGPARLAPGTFVRGRSLSAAPVVGGELGGVGHRLDAAPGYGLPVMDACTGTPCARLALFAAGCNPRPAGVFTPGGPALRHEARGLRNREAVDDAGDA